MIIDTHTHIWNAESAGTPWRSGWRQFAPRASLGADDLLSAMDDAGVAAAAVIPPEWDSRGNELVLEAAARHPDRLLAFPSISLRDPAASGQLVEWEKRKGFGGLRQIFLQASTYSPLTDGTADWLWQVADDLGLAMMVWMPGQLGQLDAIAKRYPRIRLAVDHLGLAMRPSPAELDEATTTLTELARYPNVTVKVSALPTMASDGFPFASVHPYVRSLVGAFGAERVFWGSDFARLDCSYEQAKSLMSHIGLSEPVLDAVMGGSFAAWANWPVAAIHPSDSHQQATTIPVVHTNQRED